MSLSYSNWSSKQRYIFLFWSTQRMLYLSCISTNFAAQYMDFVTHFINGSSTLRRGNHHRAYFHTQHFKCHQTAPPNVRYEVTVHKLSVLPIQRAQAAVLRAPAIYRSTIERNGCRQAVAETPCHRFSSYTTKHNLMTFQIIQYIFSTRL